MHEKGQDPIGSCDSVSTCRCCQEMIDPVSPLANSRRQTSRVCSGSFGNWRKTPQTRVFSIWHPACMKRSGMDPLTAAAAAGLQASMDSFDMLANNLANASTAGFKADREFHSTYLAAEATEDELNPSVGEAPQVQKQ